MKRVYKQVSVAAVDGGFEVRLDGRSLKSPARAPLPLLTEALAQAIAAEWDAQKDEVNPHSMPLMQLAATAIDRVSVQRDDMVNAVAAYAETDLVCYWAESPAKLVERQAKVWQPLLDWAMLRYDARLEVCSGIMPTRQPAGALKALHHAVEAYDDMMLSALQLATSTAGSLVVALALIERHIDSAAAFEVSQIDETFQIEEWGEDPEATRRRAGLKGDMEAARRFADLLRA
ncbi:MAG TPA: ATP12 family protein, partial [Azospirillaceae bacterium]|nr:ATP12 family protein [Azospirillaceae bacterium]